MWQDNDSIPEVMNFEDAKKYCENLTLDGYDTWRVPYYKELETIEDTQNVPTVDGVFENTVLGTYWTSSVLGGNTLFGINTETSRLVLVTTLSVKNGGITKVADCVGICEVEELKGNGGRHFMNARAETRALKRGIETLFGSVINFYVVNYLQIPARR